FAVAMLLREDSFFLLQIIRIIKYLLFLLVCTYFLPSLLDNVRQSTGLSRLCVTVIFTPRISAWWSFLVEAESTPGSNVQISLKILTPPGLQSLTFRLVMLCLSNYAMVFYLIITCSSTSLSPVLPSTHLLHFQKEKEKCSRNNSLFRSLHQLQYFNSLLRLNLNINRFFITFYQIYFMHN
ncbi:hypothetical protein L9F63_002130, partial [Diploptera punctata]